MSGAKIIKPTTITDSILTSSTIAEPDTGEVAWVSGATYAIGDVVIRATTHRKYARLTAGAGTIFPEVDAVNWIESGTTNKWSMFDRRIGTMSTTASPLTVVMKPGSVGAVSLLELNGRDAVISMKDTTGGTSVYSETVSLDGTIILSFYDWFFEDYVQLTGFSLTNLPSQYPSCELTVSITGTSDISCGVCIVGKLVAIGVTHYGASVGIIDYSGKEADQFGNIDIVERGYRARNSFKITIETIDFNKIYRLLANLRSTPCIVIGEDSVGFEPMTTYCLIKDFSIDVAYPSYYLCNLQTEGMT